MSYGKRFSLQYRMQTLLWSKERCECYIGKWFSSRDCFADQGLLGKLCKHFWLSRVEVEDVFLVPGGKSPGTMLSILSCLRACGKMIWPKMPVVRARTRNWYKIREKEVWLAKVRSMKRLLQTEKQWIFAEKGVEKPQVPEKLDDSFIFHIWGKF